MTVCTTTGRYYIGKHSTTILEDGYLGSGKVLQNSIKKYGKMDHHREVLEFFPSRDELAKAERALIQEHLHRPLCMNLAPGGWGGTTFRSAASRKKQSESRKGKRYPKAKGQVSPMRGRKHRPESIEKLKRNHWKGYLHDYKQRNP